MLTSIFLIKDFLSFLLPWNFNIKSKKKLRYLFQCNMDAIQVKLGFLIYKSFSEINKYIFWDFLWRIVIILKEKNIILQKYT